MNAAAPPRDAVLEPHLGLAMTPGLRSGLAALLVFVGYLLGSLLGFELRFPPATTSLLWPPNALITAALLLSPPRHWWIYLLAALPAHLLVQLPQWSPLLVLALFLTNCSEALLAASLVHAWSDAPHRFDTLRRAAVFLVGAVLLAPMLSSFLDAAVVAGLRHEPYWAVWRTRFYSNTLTELTLVPVIVWLVRTWRESAWTTAGRRGIEAGALALLLLADGALVFAGPNAGGRFVPDENGLVLLLPLLLWSAVRFGAAGSSFALLTTALIAIASHTIYGGGALAAAREVLDLQIFLLLCGIPLFGLGALIEERRSTESALAERLRFEGLLSRISAAFVHVPSDAMSAAFEEHLQQVGVFFGLQQIVLRSRLAGREKVVEITSCSAAGAAELPAGEAPPAKRLHIPLEVGSGVVGEIVATHAAARGSNDASQLRLIAEVFASALARKETEDSLRASEEMNSAILASLLSAVAVLDRDGRVVAVNASWTRMMTEGGTDLQGIGSDFLGRWQRQAAAGAPAPIGAAEGIQAVLRGTSSRYELEYRSSASAEDRWFALLVVPLLRPEGGAVASQLEITERRRAELAAQEARDELAHFQRVATVGELTTSLAHELNQPLTAILANAQAAQLMLHRENVDLAELRAILADIVDEDKRAGEVIRRLRELLRKGEPERAPVDLNALALEVLSILGSDAVIRGFSVRFELAPSPLVVSGDRVQLAQVLLNLLLNAMEAMDHCPIAERLLIVSTTRLGPSVELSVQDAGIGLGTGDPARVFAHFHSTKPTGMGMGLSIARSIVEAHGGTIRGQNNAGARGATFTVSLTLSA